MADIVVSRQFGQKCLYFERAGEAEFVWDPATCKTGVESATSGSRDTGVIRNGSAASSPCPVFGQERIASTSVVCQVRVRACARMYSKQQRLAEVYRRLGAALPASTDEDAFALLRELINEVEDELSGLPYDSDEAVMRIVSKRMYPPLADSAKATIIPGVRRFYTVHHEILIGSNGAILIRHRSSAEVELSKAGADGKVIAP